MSGHVSDVVTAAVLAFVGFRLVTGVRHMFTADGRSLWRNVVGGIGWRHIWPVPFVLTVVVVLADLLVRVPGLRWGWWTAFGGQGNPVFGTNTSTTGTVWEWLIPLVFISMLIPALPLFAFAEERMFRRGAEGWDGRRRTLKVVQFGLAHALIGIPIGTAFALSAGGAYFMTVYLRSFRVHGDPAVAEIESARAHTAYNGIIVVVVLLVVLLDAFAA
ncbi:MAG TPA: hypothetical protein VGM78_06030 [Ilumatobacteraceae bacterium]